MRVCEAHGSCQKKCTMFCIKSIETLLSVALAAYLVPPQRQAQKLFRWKLGPAEKIAYVMDQDMVQYTKFGDSKTKSDPAASSASATPTGIIRLRSRLRRSRQPGGSLTPRG